MSGCKEYQLIEKLNQHNYANWRFKVEILLIKEELFDVISADPPTPVTAEWTKRDKKARALINLVISDDQIIYVKNLSNARDTWNALKRIHERTNLSSKLYLLRKLYSIKLDEKGSMNTHITKILETVDKLKAIGEDIKQSHIAALFLCSLPASYETLITALEARPEDDLTPEFIANKLKDEYNRRQENNHPSENNTKAFHATKRHYNNNNNNNRGNYYNNNQRKEKYCSYCKMTNHTTSECGHLKRKANNNQKFRKNPNYKNNNSSSLCFETNQRQVNEAKETLKDVETATDNLSNLAFLANKSQNKTWIVDSGSSAHITNNKSLFTHIINTDETAVVIANGKELKSYCQGNIKLSTKAHDGKIGEITLKDVLFVPDLQTNLLSVKKATQGGCKVIFEGDTCNFSYNEKIFMQGKLEDNLYTVTPEKDLEKHNYANFVQECKNKNCITLWHRRTGHRHHESIKEIISKDLATGIKIDSCKHENICETCITSKLSDTPYPLKAENRSTKILQLIHSDILGPMPVPSIGQKSYVLTFIDDYSRYTTIYLLNKKNEVLPKLKEFIAYTSNKFGRKPQSIRSDNGGEYVSREMQDFLKEHGIHQQLTTPRCPSQNGVSERKNRSLIEMCRSMLSEAKLDQKFWGEAMHTANYLQNRLPTKANIKTPFEIWNGKKPNLSNLKVFGCKAFTYVHKTQRGKLDNKAIQGIFTGYDEHSKAYRIYVEGKNIVISRAVKFIENIGTSSSKTEIEKSNTKDDSSENLNLQNEEKSDTIEIELNTCSDNIQIQDNTKQEPRRSDRTNKGVPPDRLIYIAKNTHEPRNFDEVMNLQNKQEKESWINAMNEEMKSLKENETWNLIDPSHAKKRVIGCKWTYKKKYDSDGNIQKYKARLVAKGFSQKYGEDFFETFAPVVSYATIRAFLAAAVHKGSNIQHVDIKTAFLHGNLEEEVYITQPEGYTVAGQENKVCKLRKAIYGLKQAARSWHLKIGDSLKRFGFKQSKNDPCLYMKSEKDKIIHVIVYVDDILISGDQKQIEDVISFLNDEYEVKNLGQVTLYLGINIHRTDDGNILINQKPKINEIIERFNLNNSKPTNIPMNPGYLSIEGNENILPNNTQYRQAIGALLYIANISRPDIAAPVNILSRKNEKPSQCDWDAVKQVIRYLNTTKDLNLVISATEKPILKCFADADYASDKSDRKSTSGNLFMLGTTPIQWVSRKQTSVALSSAEAEYISAASATQDILWLIGILEDLDLKQNLPIVLYEDNQSTIKMIDSPKYVSKTKHIDVRLHCIRDLKEKGIINIEYCPSEHMIADIMTKPLPKPSFVKHRLNMQLKPSDISDLKGDS